MRENYILEDHQEDAKKAVPQKALQSDEKQPIATALNFWVGNTKAINYWITVFLVSPKGSSRNPEKKKILSINRSIFRWTDVEFQVLFS